jgi:hypothetical protein
MRFFRVVREMLREIFEESAYKRFCAREGLSVSRKSYARFLRDTEGSRTKVKCC